DPADEYLADGMTDELISTLSKISAFRVIARTSVMQYKSRPKTIAEIGRELRVGAVLEGSVRKAADQLRITAKLVNVKSQEPVWSQDYDLPFGDVFGVQTDVAQRVAEALQVGVLSGEKRRLERKPTQNLEAYNLYLKGRYYLEKLTEEGADKALESFNRAIDLDPTFALAYTGLSDTYYRFSNLWWPPKEVMPKARAAALKALELDESLAEAHTSLAVVKSLYDWDWAAGEKEFKRAIELNHGYAYARHMYGMLLISQGWSEKARAELKLAQELDPLSPYLAVGTVWPFYYAPPSARQYDRAISELQKIIQLTPHPLAHILLGQLYRGKKMFSEAIAELKRAAALDNSGYVVAQLGSVYAATGMKTEAQKLLAGLVKRSKSEHIASMAIAILWVSTGENDSAFIYLQKAYVARDEDMIWLNVDPWFDPLRANPRFTALLKKMGLEK
ncbi:MAG: tetratricopeptide repeat protein, partial [Limisphaerales bacterium]